MTKKHAFFILPKGFNLSKSEFNYQSIRFNERDIKIVNK